MAEIKKRSSLSPTRKLDERKAIHFLEELSWILDRYSDVDFRSLGRMLEKETFRASQFQMEFNDRSSDAPNKSVLVGLLPGMFIDELLFASNEDVAEFAETVLNVRIPSWEKKSKFELVGHIVCHTAAANDEKLSKIATALKLVSAGDKKTKSIMAKGRQQKKSWNEIIQRIIDQK